MKIETRSTAREEFCAEYFLNRERRQWNIEVYLYCNGHIMNHNRVLLPQLNFIQCHALLKILSRNCVLPKTLEEVIRELLEDATPKIGHSSRWSFSAQTNHQVH